MSPERWREVEDLYRAVLEQTPGERALLLEKAGTELRREVESLLARPSGMPGRPAWETSALSGHSPAQSLDKTGSAGTLSVGCLVGPYRIEARIGAGGMGEVWKARDTRLDRIVAIKTSSASVSVNASRARRSP